MSTQILLRTWTWGFIGQNRTYTPSKTWTLLDCLQIEDSNIVRRHGLSKEVAGRWPYSFRGLVSLLHGLWVEDTAPLKVYGSYGSRALILQRSKVDSRKILEKAKNHSKSEPRWNIYSWNYYTLDVNKVLVTKLIRATVSFDSQACKIAAIFLFLYGHDDTGKNCRSPFSLTRAGNGCRRR